MNSGEVNCRASVVAAISDAATVVVKSLKSVLNLFFLEGNLIGVCSVLTSLRLFCCQPVRRLCSAIRPNSGPLRESAQVKPIPVCNEGCVGGGVERSGGNRSGTQRRLRRNMRR